MKRIANRMFILFEALWTIAFAILLSPLLLAGFILNRYTRLRGWGQEND